MTPVIVVSEATAELNDAADFYESRAKNLGVDFALEMEMAVKSISAMPERWPERDDGTRRMLTARFPFVVVYLLHADGIWIIAFAHCKRRPGYWQQRTSGTNLKS